MADAIPIYSVDWTSHNYPHWKKHLGHLRGTPARGLEIGSYEGRSAVWWMQNILTHPESRLTCLDCWEKPDVEQRFLANTRPFSSRLAVVKQFSGLALRPLTESMFDFVYIDGSHEGMNVLEDAVLSWRLLKVGGILAFDDYEWTSAARTVLPKPAVDAFTAIYPVTILHKGYQVICRKDREHNFPRAI